VEREEEKKEKVVGTSENQHEFAGQAAETLVNILREEWAREV